MVLLILLCVFPVTTCACERCVSALRRVKTFLRTSCGQERLNGLTLLAMYRHVKIDLNHPPQSSNVLLRLENGVSISCILL